MEEYWLNLKSLSLLLSPPEQNIGTSKAIECRNRISNNNKQIGRKQMNRLSQTSHRNLISLVSVALIINLILPFVHLINCSPDQTKVTINNRNTETSAPVRLLVSDVEYADNSSQLSSPSSTSSNDQSPRSSVSSQVSTSTDSILIDALPYESLNDKDSSKQSVEDGKKITRSQILIATGKTDGRSESTDRSSSGSAQLLSMRESDVSSVSDNVSGLESVQRKRETGSLGKAKKAAASKAKGAQFEDPIETQAEKAFGQLFKRYPYSKFWSVEQKWDSIFQRLLEVQRVMTVYLTKSMLKESEYFTDLDLSEPCKEDIRYMQSYGRSKSSNYRWMTHMADSLGKDQPGMLSGNFANLGHVVQCIKTRAPKKVTNDTFDERYFEEQTNVLGERFRGKYCLVSMRPILPEKPHLVSRFSDNVLNLSLISNISYLGESEKSLKVRRNQYQLPNPLDPNERRRIIMDQVPFESELYQYIIDQRSFMYSLPRMIGVCYPSSCTNDDVRASVQKLLDFSHQVADIEFDCEMDEYSVWDYFTTPRLVCMVLMTLVATISFSASFTRHILVDRLRIRRSKLDPNSYMANLLGMLEVMSMDKCAGILFVKTKRATTIVDEGKPENNRSTSIDALKGLLVMSLIYSQLTVLGCLPIPFMWADWATAMFPFYRSLVTQPAINMSVWTEAFFIMSAYLIAVKILENGRPKFNGHDLSGHLSMPPNLMSYILKRYIRLVIPVMSFLLLNYLWPRLSNGYVMQDQAKKILEPCDRNGWTNLLMFHNYDNLTDTCLWPSHVSASFFQLHLLSYPIIAFLLVSLNKSRNSNRYKCSPYNVALYASWFLIVLFSVVGLVYPALMASNEGLIVPFLIDYIDFDNYRRVIEWTVTPTYNHLTSYMIGIGIAYFVVKRRIKQDERRASIFSSDLGGTYIHREGSFESAQSSSTQGINMRIPSRVTDAALMTPSYGSHHGQDTSASMGTRLWAIGKSCLAFFALYLSLSASFFWNGLGQPMTPSQTFCYMFATKLVFGLSFAYLFYKHIATRRNSRNPWMITRFLVPIGRMSLTAFYMSWLVIWFDLLASLYQWHPSHYFITEKFAEIMFITSILSMIVYGASEGPVMAVRYLKRKAFHNTCNQNVPVDEMVGFATMFLPDDDISSNQTSTSDNAQLGSSSHQSMPSNVKAGSKTLGNEMFTKGSSGARQYHTESQPTSAHQQAIASAYGKQVRYMYNREQASGNTDDRADDDGKHQQPGSLTSRAPRLSIADQYRLNAELRANNSFASIGLYESAGATSDLEATGDPQTSPTSTYKHR